MVKDLVKAILPEKTRLNIRYSLSKLSSLFYRGNKLYCICCDKSFRKFLPHGNIPRENARCPYCRSLERTRILMYYLQNEMNIFGTKQTILHFAPEKAIENRLKLYNKLEYITADINPTLADAVIDIQNIPFDDKKCDLVICSHVLGHVPDESKAIDEIYRVLKVGGQALILTVIDPNRSKTFENKALKTPNERLIHYGEPDLLRLHGQDFSLRLQRNGVKVERIDYSTRFTEAEKNKYRLGNKEREIIYLCKRIN